MMDDLVQVLDEEKVLYEKLADLSEEMKQAIIVSDVPVVEKKTAEQQDVTTDIQRLDRKRADIMRNVAVVLNKKPEDIKVSTLIETLSGQPELKERMTRARTELVAAMDRLKKINAQNQALLTQAMELMEFDLNLYRSMKQAPETANYNRSAYNTGDILGHGGFDATQ
jgi:flagellar biosynthesis/type III secretory pathway chaperone